MSAPCIKHRYSSYDRAVFSRNKLYRVNRRNKSKRGRLRIFYCESCGAWHIGHERAWERAQHRMES